MEDHQEDLKTQKELDTKEFKRVEVILDLLKLNTTSNRQSKLGELLRSKSNKLTVELVS